MPLYLNIDWKMFGKDDVLSCLAYVFLKTDRIVLGSLVRLSDWCLNWSGICSFYEVCILLYLVCSTIKMCVMLLQSVYSYLLAAL
jgi:hypothetical protein